MDLKDWEMSDGDKPPIQEEHQGDGEAEPQGGSIRTPAALFEPQARSNTPQGKPNLES